MQYDSPRQEGRKTTPQKCDQNPTFPSKMRPKGTPHPTLLTTAMKAEAEKITLTTEQKREQQKGIPGEGGQPEPGRWEEGDKVMCWQLCAHF